MASIMVSVRDVQEPFVCEKIGEAMPDIAGIGILVGFAGQALISMMLAVWVFFLSKIGRVGLEHDEGTAEFESEKKRLSFISSILMVGNDVQLLTGTALVITAFSGQVRTNVYHLHLVYETACFVGISSCAALACNKLITAKDRARESTPDRKDLYRIRGLPPRFRATCVYAILFLCLAVLLEYRLSKWSLDSEEGGFCYRTNGISRSGASHPASDQIYVAISATWLLAVILATIFASVNIRKTLMVLCFLQFVIHLYFMIALRKANSEYLEGEESEDNWDFGQTTAILLLATVIGELFGKAVQYYRFEKDLKHGPRYALDRAEEREVEEEKNPGMAVGPITFIARSVFRMASPAKPENHEMAQSLTRSTRKSNSEEA